MLALFQSVTGFKTARQGVTVVELLVVIGIIVILATLSAPAVNRVMRASQLTYAGSLLSDHLALARQTALSKNHNVEFRFYQFAEPGAQGEQQRGQNHQRI